MTKPVTKPDEILADYQEALRKAYGDEIADKSTLHYHRGWFYVNVARRFPDGSVGHIGSPADALRGAKVKELTRILFKRMKATEE